ncbi:hypothetical protein Bp8pC_198 [Bacillus phage Bp8p-C]|uniref:Uncharacterized protein n=2 Tax=Agatevirus Bp8pC TaxID=1910937 RepID=A0A0A0PJF2_9CAUD|nr:hypothetical protein AXJ20_gp150 [Bacillus phage Bp8p-C]YP_009784498.1 hypothetical protein QLX39_gp150 [Bacillus phage Bp8p-T]AHJ87628.1 hypothetical protein Bp8pC_198 [Bacillus phage Bp8p-C]AHJ87839.1 hypothetical protein Bp8pT_198 [Bacillus phage Bp8p-T]
MEKKLIEELTQDELKKVWENNPKLRQQVQEDAAEGEMYWVGDRLHYVKSYLSNWSIGGFSHVYMTIDDYQGFLEGAEKLSKDMGLFTTEEEDRKALDSMKQAQEAYLNADTDEECDELYEKFENVCDSIAQLLANNMKDAVESCYTDENAFDYFLEFYVDNRLDDEYYVEPENDYKLFKTVTESF